MDGIDDDGACKGAQVARWGENPFGNRRLLRPIDGCRFRRSTCEFASIRINSHQFTSIHINSHQFPCLLHTINTSLSSSSPWRQEVAREQMMCCTAFILSSFPPLSCLAWLSLSLCLSECLSVSVCVCVCMCVCLCVCACMMGRPTTHSRPPKARFPLYISNAQAHAHARPSTNRGSLRHGWISSKVYP
jgi:hypothetical protein